MELVGTHRIPCWMEARASDTIAFVGTKPYNSSIRWLYEVALDASSFQWSQIRLRPSNGGCLGGTTVVSKGMKLYYLFTGAMLRVARSFESSVWFVVT